MEQDKKQVAWREFCKIFWVFILGSFLGFLYENILVIFQKGYFELRQGLIYGPFIPVYGIGGIVYYLYFRFAKPKDKLEVFFLSMILRWNYRISSFLYPRSSFWNDFMGLFLFKI